MHPGADLIWLYSGLFLPLPSLRYWPIKPTINLMLNRKPRKVRMAGLVNSGAKLVEKEECGQYGYKRGNDSKPLGDCNEMLWK